MDRGAWRATVWWGHKESDTLTEYNTPYRTGVAYAYLIIKNIVDQVLFNL